MTHKEFLRELAQTPEFAKHPILEALLRKDDKNNDSNKRPAPYSEMAYWKRA